MRVPASMIVAACMGSALSTCGGRRGQVSEESEKPPIEGGRLFRLVVKGWVVPRVIYLAAQAQTHSEQGLWPEVAADLQDLIKTCALGKSNGMTEMDPPPYVFFHLGLAHEQNRDLVKAFEALRKAIEGDPGNILARMALARVAVERFDYERAISEYNNAYNFIMDNRDFITNDRDDYDNLDADMLGSAVLNDLGSTLMIMDRLDEAEKVLIRAISMNSDSSYAFGNLAIIAGTRGNESGMRKYLDIALEKAEGNDHPLINLLLQEAANAKLGDVILEVLWANHRITNAVYVQQKKALQTRPQNLSKGPEPIRIYTKGGAIMTGSGNYVNQGTAGAMGDNATNYGTSQQFIQAVPSSDIDMQALVAELVRLKSQLLSDATNSEHYHAVAEIESAKTAAEESDQVAVMRHLKAAGQWTLEVATKIGTSVAVAALKAALNLPA